jgi:hypothetical protein
MIKLNSGSFIFGTKTENNSHTKIKPVKIFFEDLMSAFNQFEEFILIELKNDDDRQMILQQEVNEHEVIEEQITIKIPFVLNSDTSNFGHIEVAKNSNATKESEQMVTSIGLIGLLEHGSFNYIYPHKANRELETDPVICDGK